MSTPEILLSPAALARFLNGTEEAAAILRDGQSAPPPRPIDRWDVHCLSELTEIYHFAAYLILTAASYVLDGFCLPDLSKRVWVLSRHEFTDATLVKTQKIFQEHFLSRSVNTHQKETADFYLQQAARYTFAGQSEASHLEFFHSGGVCRGMNHWFVYLYFKTLGRFPSSQDHIRAVGMQFEQGASRQAAFLQSITPIAPIYDLLQLNVQTDYAKIDSRGKTHEQISQEIQVLAPGVYGIYVGNHQVVYIKTGGHQFLFDPNNGTFNVDSQILFNKVMARYFDKHDDSQEILIDRYSPR